MKTTKARGWILWFRLSVTESKMARCHFYWSNGNRQRIKSCSFEAEQHRNQIFFPAWERNYSPKLRCCCEGFMLCYWKDKKKPFPTAEIVISDSCIILLSCCVQNVYLNFFTIQNYFLSVAVSLGRFIVFYKLTRKGLVFRITVKQSQYLSIFLLSLQWHLNSPKPSHNSVS